MVINEVQCWYILVGLKYRMSVVIFFFFNDTATTEIYTLSLHDALPICWFVLEHTPRNEYSGNPNFKMARNYGTTVFSFFVRSEEHTSELQSRQYLVCRLLLEKKKTKLSRSISSYSQRRTPA